MNRVNPKKLQHSKWTAVQPIRREKHFIVTSVRRDDAGVPVACVLEAVHGHQERELNWRELKDATRWRMGWQ